MKKGKSEIILILDRSGSMANIRNDMEGGIKNYIEKQKKEPGECYVSLYQFDDVYEPVFEYKNITNVGEISLVPRNMTALWDAVCKTINSVGDRLANTPESERPESIIITVITDGNENSSKEFTLQQVKDLVKQQADKYNWRFIFLGANQDAVLNGTNMGFGAGTSMTYASNSKGVSNSFDSLNIATCTYRTCNASSYAFSDEDRKKALAEDKEDKKVQSK